MKQVLDLHIHSKYSRACSPQLTLENIAIICSVKGIDIISTGDFTHPLWFKEIKNKLEEISQTGLYQLKNSNLKTKFILGTEVSLVYKDKGKTRRIHLLLHAPNLEAVIKLNDKLSERFNLRSDGRPILGISAPKFCALCFSISKDFLIYPAHIWTPWYSVFGSKSGFNSLSECFEEYTDKIYAIETGLSSDPEMNWRISALDKLSIISSSDAHSLNNLGREATIMNFSGEATYQKIYHNLKTKQNLELTLEFYPEEGMYYFDGHRNCSFSCSPTETLKLKDLCPVCHKPLVVGVLSRVEELANRPLGYKLSKATPFKKIIELDKIIAEVLHVKSRTAKKVLIEYNKLIAVFGTELFILLEADLEKITKVSSARLAKAIILIRQGKINIKPGFDGEYGQLKIFEEK